MIDIIPRIDHDMNIHENEKHTTLHVFCPANMLMIYHSCTHRCQKKTPFTCFSHNLSNISWVFLCVWPIGHSADVPTEFFH